MQQQEFELSMSKFFDKAGVQIIKKGEGYDDLPSYPTYILLDTKRKSYYAAESDVYESEINDENINQFALDTSLNQHNARAVFALSRAVNAVDNSFSLNNGTDLTSLNKKSALIISDENSSQIKEYLESNSYKFQSVPLKGQFLVIFIDESMQEKLSEIYSSYTGNTTEENTLADDDIAPVFEPKENADTQDINLNVQDNNYDAETPLVTPKEEATQEDIEAEELLENIDLNDLIKPKEVEDMPKDETEADLLYGKFLNEQTEKIEVSGNGPVEKSIDEVPEGLINDEDIKEMTSESDNSNKNATLSKEEKKAAKLREKEEKKQARLAEKQQRQAQKENDGTKSWLDIPGRIFANIIGIIFFLPVYILNKLLGRFLPPFVLYWLAAIIAVYGVYQILFSFIPQPFNDEFRSSANEAITYMQSLNIAEDNSTQPVNQLAETSLSMVKTSAVMFDAFLQGINAVMEKGILLQYLLGFAAALLIIPAFRFIGKSLTIFAVLSYFLLPVAAYSQSKLIMYAFELNAVNLTAAAVTFIVYIYPVILLFAVLYISSALVPDKEKRREVLP